VLARLVGLEKDSGKTGNGKSEVKNENGKEMDIKPENGTTVSTLVWCVRVCADGDCRYYKRNRGKQSLNS
jgi:hypothetical protein